MFDIFRSFRSLHSFETLTVRFKYFSRFTKELRLRLCVVFVLVFDFRFYFLKTIFHPIKF